MGQTLTHGVYLPDEGERNCYSGLAANWQILDTSVGTIAANTAALSEKAPLVHTHTKSDITDFPAYGNAAGTICEGNDARLSDARTPVAHTHGKSDVTDLFNSANTWSASQTFTDINRQFPTAEKGVTPSSNNNRYEYINDKNGVNLGYCQFSYNTAGNLTYSLRVENLYDSNNQLSPNGSAKYAYTALSVMSDGTPNYRIYANTIPNNTNRFDLGSSANQWNNLYAKNYYYNGTAWGLDKTNFWTSPNYFTLSMHQKGFTARAQTPVSSEFGSHGILDINNAPIISFNYANRNTGARDISIRVYDNTGNANGAGVFKDLNDKYYFGSIDPNNTIELGTLTNKWKSLNGINPGALSLPDYTLAKVDLIDFSQWSVSGQRNEYTPISDGWLFVNIKDTASNSVFIYAHSLYNSADPTKSTDYSASCFGNGSQGAAGRIAVMLPVRAGVVYGIFIKAASVSDIFSAKFYPALGNV